ncbi:MAG: hypothetical protein HY903_23495 [Deltaproteobacteria bacterium]|nr:hypothetical protein [Deltaproteobacteria bacterium]
MKTLAQGLFGRGTVNKTQAVDSRKQFDAAQVRTEVLTGKTGITEYESKSAMLGVLSDFISDRKPLTIESLKDYQDSVNPNRYPGDLREALVLGRIGAHLLISYLSKRTG